MVAFGLFLFILLLVSFPFYVHLLAPAELSKRGAGINWVFYLIPLLVCWLILLSPFLTRFRTGDFEIELNPEIGTIPEPELTPSMAKALKD